MKTTVMAILWSLCLPMMVHANLVTETFVATITNGILTGEEGSGSFTYDASLISSEEDWLTPADGLQVTFTFDGQTFTEINDAEYDEVTKDYPVLYFSNSEIEYLDYWLVDEINGVEFNNPIIGDLFFIFLSRSTGSYDYEISVDVDYVPLPGTLCLLFSGLSSMIMIRKRRYKKH